MYELELLQHSPQEIDSNRPPLLFLHGMSHGAWCWEPNYLPYFAEQGWDSYALSLRGHGDSDGLDDLNTFTMEDYCDDLLAIAEDFEQAPIIIGHCMGGGVLQMAMQTGKLNAAAAVLLASIPPDGFSTMEKLSLAATSVSTITALKSLMKGEQLSLDEMRHLNFYDNDVDQETLELCQQHLQAESKIVRDDIQHFGLKRFDSTLPLLVVGSSKDHIFGKGALQRTAKRYKTDAHILSRGCHALMLSDYWQDSADVIVDWLNERF